MLKLVIFIVGFVLGAYLLIVALVYFGQSKLIYFPSGSVNLTPAEIGANYDDVWLITEDNITIHGWYVQAPHASKTLLFFHGNGGNISHRLSSIEVFLELNLNVLIIDYRGYGKSQGFPNEQGTYKDANAAWQFLLEQGHQPGDILVFGRSLGGAVAMWLAVKTKPSAIILESTFSSLGDIGKHYYPWLPVRWLLKYKYDALSLSKLITIPALVIHSPEDTLIPFYLGQKLFDGLGSRKKFLTIRGDHNDGFLGSRDHYINGLSEFIDTL